MSIQDLSASLDLKQNLNIYATCKQFDNLNLILSVYDNSLQVDLSNYNVKLRAMKADMVPLIQENVGIALNNNVVSIEAHEQLTTTAGNTPIELQFIDKTTGLKKATFNLVLVVVASAIAIDASISKATYTLLEELENKIDQCSDFFENIDTAKTANTNLINSTNTANSTKQALDNSNTTATETKKALDTSNTNATNTKNALDTLNTAANNTKNSLNTVNQTGQNLLDSLETFEQEHEDVSDISNKLSQKANLASTNFKACYLAKTLEKLYKEVDDVLITFIGDSVTCGSNATDQTLKGYVGLFASWIAIQFPDSTVILARGSNITSLQPLTGFAETTIQTGSKNTVRIVNAGIWGDSMFQLFNRTNNFIKYKNITPDCIFLMDGINDSDPGNTNRYSSVSEFKELQRAFVDYLKDSTDSEIVIQTSHWAGGNPNSRINPYVVAQRELANEKNLLLVDHKFVWDNHYSFGLTNHGQGDWMTSTDEIHPTDIGHKAILNNITENMFKTRNDNGILRNVKSLSEIEGITYIGTWEDKIISDSATTTTYTYKRTNTVGSYFTAPLAGNEIYAIVRDGRDSVVFNNNSPQYDSNEQIKIGGMVYPSVLVTVNDEDMYAKHHKRVLLYKGKYKYCEVTLQHVSGNLDVYGFETVTYKGEGTEDDTSTSLTLYCDSINGSDSNDGFNTTTAFKTIAKAINYSRDYLDKAITINVMENTTENVDFTNIYPHSIDSYIIKGYNNVVKQIGYFHAQQVGKFRLDYIKTVTNSDYSILLNDVSMCRLNYVDISDATNPNKTGLYLSNGSRCFTSTLNGDYKNELVHCENGSQLVIGLTNNPTNCTTLANATTGGIINFTNANIPQYTAKLTKSSGGVMFNVNGTVM